MGENTFKVKEPVKKKKGGLFFLLENRLKIDSLEKGVPVKYLPYILYVTVIGIFYIGNIHYAEKTIRKINKLKIEVEDMRADFTTLKADYMKASKQSEVAIKVAPLGLKESLKPPYKIVIEESEY